MDERLSWPGWLTYSKRSTHVSGHPSATGRAQDRESSLAKDRRPTTVPRHQPLFRTIWLSSVTDAVHLYGIIFHIYNIANFQFEVKWQKVRVNYLTDKLVEFSYVSSSLFVVENV